MTEKVSIEEYQRRRGLWYAWLRDPAHEQTAGRLKRERINGSASYCCLGGACEVYHAETGKGSWFSIKDDIFFGNPDGPLSDETDNPRRSWSVLPNNAQQWLGLQTASGREPSDFRSTPKELTNCNDGGWLTFSQIADFCEQNPPGLWQEGTY